MGEINFDAQRAEAGIEAHTITVGGREVELPSILSLEFGAAMAAGDIEAALEVLVTDDEGEVDEDLASHLLRHLALDDLDQIATELYGLTDGTEDGEAPNRAARRERAKKSKRKGNGGSRG